VARIVVIGDVGGCSAELAKALATLPDDPDTVIIQVGDLVDRGPDSAGVLDMVRSRLPSRRWIQLIGNHEWQYLDGEGFWPEPLSADSAALLSGWWQADRLQVAAAIRTADGEEFLLSHAGLTLDAWRLLGGPVVAATAADLLNTRPFELLNDYGGPLWAEAVTVYESWLRGGDPVPFGQIHGHSSVVDFTRLAWFCPERLRQRATVDWTARHTTTRISLSHFIGVDPHHGRTGAPQWSPLILEGATLLR
jgi:hypothetical protein